MSGKSSDGRSHPRKAARRARSIARRSGDGLRDAELAHERSRSGGARRPWAILCPSSATSTTSRPCAESESLHGRSLLPSTEEGFNVSTSMLRTIACTAAMFAVILLGTAVEAQNFAPAGPGFHVESAPRREGRPAVEGYVYNERSAWLSDVRVRVEVFDSDGTRVEETFGWVLGNLGPGGRGYFVVAVKRLGTAYRVSVVSFNVVPQGGA